MACQNEKIILYEFTVIIIAIHVWGEGEGVIVYWDTKSAVRGILGRKEMMIIGIL